MASAIYVLAEVVPPNRRSPAFAAFIAPFALLWAASVLARTPAGRALRAGRLGAFLRVRWGGGLDLDELARRLGVRPEALPGFRSEYRAARIPKRGRAGGWRDLAIPEPPLRALQRTILVRLLRPLRAHPAATGFERGRSIVDNARPHRGRAVVVRMDVRDFFPSTTAPRVEAYFRRIGWNQEAASILTRLVTHEGGLPQGAPTSPRLSNLLNFGLDALLARLAERYQAVYTRYADDITFSFAKDRPRKVRGIIQQASRILCRFGYRPHRREKLSVRRRHQRQVVTGLVVNDDVRLPRSRRRWLRAVRHRLALGREATISPEALAGWDAFAAMVERQARPRLPDPGSDHPLDPR